MRTNRFRLISRLDIKGPNLIKGIHLEGLRVIGNPQIYAQKYYEQGADELIYMDTVASLYNRNNLTEILQNTAKDVFIPITAGGGIRSIEDVKSVLRSGADKVAINTAAIKNPSLITEVAKKYGSQCMVLSVEAKRITSGKWEAYTDNGRQTTGLDAIDWMKKGIDLGAGEILLTSVDMEGTRKGFDLDLYEKISSLISVPIIASGGYGKPEHLTELTNKTTVDAVAFADSIHYNRSTMLDIRNHAKSIHLPVRELP